MAPERRHVVAVRLGQLGDLVMVFPALCWLLSHSELRVTLVTGSHYAGFLGRRFPALDVVTPGEVGRLEPAHAVLDLHGVSASRRVVQRVPRFLRAVRVATRKESIRRRSLVLSGRWPQVLGGERVRRLPRWTWPERHLVAVSEVFVRLGFPESGWPARPSAVPRLPVMEKAGGGDSSVLRPSLGLCPGASWKTKQWPAHHWRELALRWSRLERSSSWLFASPQERPLLEEVLAGGTAEPWASSSLDGLAEGLAVCDVVVCGDSGPLHLAGALGVPVVGLYGPTPIEAGFWVWGGRGRYLRDELLPCAPCSLHGQDRCPLSHHQCLEGLPPSLVFDAAWALVSGEGDGAASGMDLDLVATVRNPGP